MALSRVATHLPAVPKQVTEAKPLTSDQIEQLNALILRGAPFDKTTYSAVLPWLKMHFSDKYVREAIEKLIGYRVTGVDMGKSIVYNLPHKKLEHSAIYTKDGTYGLRERGTRKRTIVFVQIHFENGLHYITSVVPADKL
ncbi:hypothetical protein Xoosp14_93 [Xanthomonas phage Xoo-sp14]|nr:hypothetical protein Xoosp14_93 [Xanthomonas phage Xoo-sp14]